MRKLENGNIELYFNQSKVQYAAQENLLFVPADQAHLEDEAYF
jgi:hypothetical protein